MAPGDLIRLSSSFCSRFRQLRRYLACRPDDQRLAFFVYWIMPPPGPLVMGPSIFLFNLLKSLVFSGTLSRLVGFGLVFLHCV